MVTNPAISDWFSARSVFFYLYPRVTVMLSWVAEYIPTFVVIFYKHISFLRLGSIFKQRRSHYLKSTNNLLFLSFLSLSNHFGWQKNIGFEFNLYKQTFC